jgi:hypothetical protein
MYRSVKMAVLPWCFAHLDMFNDQSIYIGTPVRSTTLCIFKHMYKIFSTHSGPADRLNVPAIVTTEWHSLLLQWMTSISHTWWVFGYAYTLGLAVSHMLKWIEGVNLLISTILWSFRGPVNKEPLSKITWGCLQEDQECLLSFYISFSPLMYHKLHISFIPFLGCIRAWTQGLTLARQVLYHLNHVSASLALVNFQI